MGWTDEQIHHPRNLIALHPDDHAVIHGDTYPFNTYVIDASKPGRANARWIGVKVTPFGRFDTVEELIDTLNITISANYLNKLCQGKMGPITRGQYCKSEILQLCGEDCIGKTPTEIGFSLDTSDVNVPNKRMGRATGTRHGGFSGYYHTPWGCFITAKDAANSSPVNVSSTHIRTLCKYKNSEHITFKQRTQSKLLQLYECLGATPQMIGFGHDEVLEELVDPVPFDMYCHSKQGCFHAIKELGENFPEMTDSYVVDIFEKGTSRIITKSAFTKSEYLKSLGECVIGQTWRDLGFYMKRVVYNEASMKYNEI